MLTSTARPTPSVIGWPPREPGQGSLVGILLDRSISSIIAFLAVLKAGGVFVPLDPASPPQSLLDIIRHHKLACVVSNGATLRRLPQLAAEAAALIDVDATPLSRPAGHPVLAPKVSGSDSACVMFTSGSTGEPKGVVIPHRAIVRLVKDPGYMRVFGGSNLPASLALGLRCFDF